LMYWMKGKIFTYTKYKAPHYQVIVNRVSPKNTSRRCPYCGKLAIVRYTESPKRWSGVELAHCIECKTHALHADFVGSCGVGTNFRQKYIV
jgi:putative transposase